MTLRNNDLAKLAKLHSVDQIETEIDLQVLQDMLLELRLDVYDLQCERDKRARFGIERFIGPVAICVGFIIYFLAQGL